VKVFVAVGTTEFDGLVEAMDRLSTKLDAEIVLQIGRGAYEPKNCDFLRLAPSLEPYYEWADIVVAHGGFGTTMEVLHKGKRLISLSNPDRYDKHQSDLLGTLEAEGYLVWCRRLEDLPHLLSQIDTMTLRPYQPPECHIHHVIAEFLEKQ